MHARPSPERPVSAQGGRGFVSQNTRETCTATPLELNHPFICVFETNDMHHTPTESNVSFSLLWWVESESNQRHEDFQSSAATC